MMRKFTSILRVSFAHCPSSSLCTDTHDLNSKDVGMHYGKLMEDTGYPLAAMLKKEGDTIYYLYDLGDGWQHRIVLEEIVPEEEDVTLIDGAGGCPPEDSCGLENKGCGGYAELLEMVRRGPNKAEVKAALKEVSRTAVNYSRPWTGGPPLPFRPLEYNLDYHRSLLDLMVTGPSVKKTGQFPVEGGECFKESMRECSNCGSRLKTLSRCLGCKKVWYCSREFSQVCCSISFDHRSLKSTSRRLSSGELERAQERMQGGAEEVKG